MANGNVGKTEVRAKERIRVYRRYFEKTLKISRRVRRWRRLKRKRGRRRIEECIDDIVRKTLKISGRVRRWRRLRDMEGTD
jgi:hypothetical protein